MLCIPRCDLLLPHISCHLILHQNLKRGYGITYENIVQTNIHIHTSEKHLTHSTQPVIMCFLGHAEIAPRSDCLLFLAKVHLVPGSPACENLDHSHHTVEKDREKKYKEKQVRKPWMKQIQNYFLELCYFDTKDSGWFSNTLYQTVMRRRVGDIFFTLA